MTGSDNTRLGDDEIDLDRVIIDPIYRRGVIERLRAEAARRPAPLLLTEPAPTRDD
ncbi:MAG TPA: hypothetical protein VLX85_14940 [Stellaceae bacterium]|nr:hypothetical protein [Stellaceae bacterium]